MTGSQRIHLVDGHFLPENIAIAMINRVLAVLLLRQSTNRKISSVFGVGILRAMFVLSLSMLVGSVFLLALLYLLSSPPLQWFYEVGESAGNSTIYVPGGGFAGFWFHLGYLQSIENPEMYDYYCFSSGCLGVLSALMNLGFDEVADAAFESQQMWVDGQLSRYDVVTHFVDRLVPSDSNSLERLNQILPNLKVLVTSTTSGHKVAEATNRDELLDLMIRTTWIPYVSGWGMFQEGDEVFLDGGFSRRLHPSCEFRLDLPIVWETMVHAFSVGLDREQVASLWKAGTLYDYSIPKIDACDFLSPQQTVGLS